MFCVQFGGLSRSGSERVGSALGSVFLPPSLGSCLTREQQHQASRVQFSFYTKPSLFLVCPPSDPDPEPGPVLAPVRLFHSPSPSFAGRSLKQPDSGGSSSGLQRGQSLNQQPDREYRVHHPKPRPGPGESLHSRTSPGFKITRCLCSQPPRVVSCVFWDFSLNGELRNRVS